MVSNPLIILGAFLWTLSRSPTSFLKGCTKSGHSTPAETTLGPRSGQTASLVLPDMPVDTAQNELHLSAVALSCCLTLSPTVASRAFSAALLPTSSTPLISPSLLEGISSGKSLGVYLSKSGDHPTLTSHGEDLHITTFVQMPRVPLSHPNQPSRIGLCG